MTIRLRGKLARALLALGLTGLAGCSGADATGDAPPAQQAASVSIRDAWVKSADSGMSAAFGVLVNSGPTEVTVVSSASESSPVIELHETVENDSGQMVMREKDGGFVIPAGGEHALAPGGNHFMLMDLAEPVKAGDTVGFTVTFADGSTYDFDAPAKDYTGANEQYEHG
jgi:copper(I)-binding protein